jgi:DNA-directed RNA polymerase subunit M/transcription elongation factor TFIIS
MLFFKMKTISPSKELLNTMKEGINNLIDNIIKYVTTRPKCNNSSCSKYGQTKEKKRDTTGTEYYECSGCGG